MTLHLEGGLARGTLAIDMDLAVGRETVALVGPNGAGKSTTLKLIAGLLRLDRGSLRCDDDVWDDGAGRFTVSEDRRVAWLPQDPLLFPHLDVLSNVAFGPRSRGASRTDASQLAAAMLERLDLGRFAARKPETLSGGEARKVAIARALVTRPRVLLLDEPFAGIDVSAAVDLRKELASCFSDFDGPVILVTHAAVDAFMLADRIAVVECGRRVQIGTAEALGAAPATRYVADLVGLNFLRGRVHDGLLTLDDGGTLVVAHPVEGPVTATIHPRAVSLHLSRPDGSPRNVWSTTVTSVEPSPGSARVRVEGPIPLVAEITHATVRTLSLRPGSAVFVAVKATEITLTPV